MRLHDVEMARVDEFKYLGSTVQSNGECGREVKKRLQAGWSGWRKVTGVICDSRVSAKIKGKVYKTVVVWYGDSTFDKKTGGRVGSDRTEDAVVFVRSDGAR